MKKNKGLEFEVERFKAVKLKNDMKIQMLEQKSKSSDEAKKQIELDLKNDDCKKKELIDKTRKVNNCFVIYIQISHRVRFDSNFFPTFIYQPCTNRNLFIQAFPGTPPRFN